MALAWATDTAALFYVLGVWLQGHAPTGAGRGSNLLGMVAVLVLVLMLGASAVLRFAIPSPGAKRLALLIAGGQPAGIDGRNITRVRRGAA